MWSINSHKPKELQQTTNSSGPLPPVQGSSRKRKQVLDSVSRGLNFTANIAEASDILAPLKAACKATQSIIEVVQAVESNNEDWNDLARRLKDYMSAVEDQMASFKSYPKNERTVDEAFSRPLIRYVEYLEDFLGMVNDLSEKRSQSTSSKLRAAAKIKVDVEEIRNITRGMEDRHRQFMEAMSSFAAYRAPVIERNTKAIMTDVDASAILQLPMVEFIASSVHATCLQGTREAVLETIWRWAEDIMSEKPIFWLCDIAGSGKSTVSMSAVQRWRTEGILGGQFFFSIASGEAASTNRFCSTIAREIAHRVPDLGPRIAEAVKRSPAIMRSSLQEQFQTLIIEPLRYWQGRVVLVIDAIDECKSGVQRRELVDTLTMAVLEGEPLKNLKIFITSRPDPVIEAVLQPLSIKAQLKDRLHDVSHRDNIDDIATYVHKSLQDVLSEDRRQRVIAKANGLFIWASTACRMLTSETSLSSPESIYERLVSAHQAGGIDEVYDLVLERTDPVQYTTMCQMLALLLAAFEPLTVRELDDIIKHAKVDGSVKALIRNLGSILIEDGMTGLIQFRHPTLIEYLRRRTTTISTLDGCRKFHLDMANAHGQAASWCLSCLQSRRDGPKFNICKIESSFYLNKQLPDLETRVAKFISRLLQYASSHWSFHLAETSVEWRQRLKKALAHVIQSPYVLYWMEVLSLTGRVRGAIVGLRAIMCCADFDKETRSRITDIRRFLMAFLVPIQDSAPHIYISALPFAPAKSILATENAGSHGNTLKVGRGVEEMYFGLPECLRGHKAAINAVAFSPDGSLIVSGSDDSRIRLWDAETGQPVGEPLRGHDGDVNAVAFSPDGSRIVSGSDDKTIRLWDPETGQPVGEPLLGHRHLISAVAFSSDGLKVVSGSWDKTVRLWDVETGQPIGKPLRGHNDWINAVAFSPDGLRIASGSSDATIRIWDMETSQQVGEPLRGHNEPVTAVTFSPDGSQIVSGSWDSSIRLWDAETGQPTGEPLYGHNKPVTAVTFSPDGLSLASGSWEQKVRLWDVRTGQPVGEPLQGHDGWVNTVAFSPDGLRVASGSSDTMIRLWDVESGQPVGEPLQGHNEPVTAVAISPDSLRVISGSWDSTIRIWDLDAGQLVGEPLRGHKHAVNAVAFSLDGSRIVSGSSDRTIRLWDVETGQPIGEPFRGHKHLVNAVAFSPDGSRVVSGSSDKTIRLWDTETGQQVGRPFQGHHDWVRAVAFSPDGLRIVSGSDDRMVRLWNAETGQLVGESLRAHNDWVNTVTFSHDGFLIASGSSDNSIRLWDALTGQPLGEALRGHHNSVNSISFSPDSLKIVSASSDRTVRLWNAETGQPVGEPLQGHDHWIKAVSFSPDGSQVVSGSSDKTIRLWKVAAHGGGLDTPKHDPSRVSLGAPLTLQVPGFERCSLLDDGWVESSGKMLFWVPSENRHGLLYPHTLTIPTRSLFRATNLDFTHFHCGSSWTNVRNTIAH